MLSHWLLAVRILGDGGAPTWSPNCVAVTCECVFCIAACQVSWPQSVSKTTFLDSTCHVIGQVMSRSVIFSFCYGM